MRSHHIFLTIAGHLLVQAHESTAFMASTCPRNQPPLPATTDSNSYGEDAHSSNLLQQNQFSSNPLTSRRHLILTSLLAGTALSTAPPPSQANTTSVVSTGKLASLLSTIPTFAIVDPKGVPYFVVGEDAKLTSYFFLSYPEAKRILDVADKSADRAIKNAKDELKKKRGKLTQEDIEEIGTNPWKEARITSVTLDLAVSLASKGKLAGAYFRLAPSESDIEDALSIDGSEDLPEGKVPLFYVEDFTIHEGGESMSPLYFSKGQLVQEWKKGNTSEPEVKVTELFATLTEMLRPGGTDEELKTLVFVAPKDSGKRAKEVLAGEKEPFRLGERNIVL